MLDKSYLTERIQASFPDLAGSRFSFNNVPVSSFTERSLIPFLCYQNTVDAHHRLIGLYLPESCSIINLIPFYVIMGQYRKALDTVMHARNYQSQFFASNEKQVVFKGDICSITTVDFINRQLTLRNGRGKEVNVSFFESYQLKWNFRNAQDISNRIDAFEQVYKTAQGNIFSFPIVPKDRQYEGVIIFTNTSKFESLLRNVRVSGSDLRNHLNIQKVVFPSSNEDIRFVRLSASGTERKPVSVLVARQDAFRAYDAIRAAGNGKLDHVRTIIIDDFDDLMSRWERTDIISEELDWLKDNYYRKVEDRQVKDLYLISRNSSIGFHRWFKESGINVYPWLLKPVESFVLDNEAEKNVTPEIILNQLGEQGFEELSSSLNALIGRWKALAQTNFCSGEPISIIKCLYELRTKVTTFFSPEKLNEFAEALLHDLDILKRQYFNSGQDYNLINDTKELIQKQLGSEHPPANYKLNVLKSMLKDESDLEDVTIVADNDEADDIWWLLDNLKTLFPKLHIHYFHWKEFIRSNSSNSIPPRLLFYLSSNKKIIGSALTNVLADKQVFVLGEKAWSFTKNSIRHFERIISDAAQTADKYRLLNIQAPVQGIGQETTGLIAVKYDSKTVSDQQVPVAAPDPELQDLVEEIVCKQPARLATDPVDNLLLFFSDGSLGQYTATRHFFLFDEEKETVDIDKLIKIAADLKEGDQVIVPRHGHHVAELLEKTLKKNAAYNDIIGMDTKWRLLMNLHITRNRWDVEYFRRKLKQHDFTIGSDQTVKNWIDGFTRRPDNFRNLLTALSRLGIIHPEEVDAYDRCNSELKSIQSGFVRTAIRKLLCRINGIAQAEDEFFNDELLSDFINLIEIKKINAIYKL